MKAVDEPCASGLHASRRMIDALRYAPGNTIWRVSPRGDAVEVTEVVEFCADFERLLTLAERNDDENR